jgi:hypothetical protein
MGDGKVSSTSFTTGTSTKPSTWASYSAKELIAIQCHIAYKKAHSRQGTCTSSVATVQSSAPDLPQALVAEALQLELPVTSTLFQDAAKSADLLDKTGLEIWDLGPPYITGPPSDSIGELEYTQRLQHVMHRRHLPMLRETEYTWQQVSTEVLTEMLDNAITQWEVGKCFIAQYEDGHWECAMVKLWLQWVAQEASSLHLTVHTRTHSFDV